MRGVRLREVLRLHAVRGRGQLVQARSALRRRRGVRQGQLPRDTVPHAQQHRGSTPGRAQPDHSRRRAPGLPRCAPALPGRHPEEPVLHRRHLALAEAPSGPRGVAPIVGGHAGRRGGPRARRHQLLPLGRRERAGGAARGARLLQRVPLSQYVAGADARRPRTRDGRASEALERVRRRVLRVRHRGVLRQRPQRRRVRERPQAPSARVPRVRGRRSVHPDPRPGQPAAAQRRHGVRAHPPRGAPRPIGQQLQPRHPVRPGPPVGPGSGQTIGHRRRGGVVLPLA